MKNDPPSFASAASLRKLIEALPAVPEWKSVEIKVPGYSAKDPIILYWRDGLEVVESLFANPIFASSMETTPYKLFDENNRPVISEFMSAKFASRVHVCSISCYTSILIYSYLPSI